MLFRSDTHYGSVGSDKKCTRVCFLSLRINTIQECFLIFFLSTFLLKRQLWCPARATSRIAASSRPIVAASWRRGEVAPDRLDVSARMLTRCRCLADRWSDMLVSANVLFLRAGVERDPTRADTRKTLIIKLKNMVNWWRTHIFFEQLKN